MAAAQAGREIVLASAPGPGWFKALVAAARDAVPGASCTSLLDCGDSVGAALAAIRAEVEGVTFIGREDAAGRLADIARQQGVRFETNRPPAALDLAGDFFATPDDLERRCAQFLRGDA